MKKKLKINVSKNPQSDGVVSCRNVSIRERILDFLFGSKPRVTILVPGDSVDEISICGEKEGKERDGRAQ